jgi:hypothetical protein
MVDVDTNDTNAMLQLGHSPETASAKSGQLQVRVPYRMRSHLLVLRQGCQFGARMLQRIVIDPSVVRAATKELFKQHAHAIETNCGATCLV